MKKIVSTHLLILLISISSSFAQNATKSIFTFCNMTTDTLTLSQFNSFISQSNGNNVLSSSFSNFIVNSFKVTTTTNGVFTEIVNTGNSLSPNTVAAIRSNFSSGIYLSKLILTISSGSIEGKPIQDLNRIIFLKN